MTKNISCLGYESVGARADHMQKDAPSLDRGVEVAPGAEFHDFAPVQVLVLDEIDGLDDVGMVEGGGDAKLGGQFLDVFLFALVFAALAEFLAKGVGWGGDKMIKN